jgi:hypothetical protein
LALLRPDVIEDGTVVNDGVWHRSQWMLLNSERPFKMDVAPPGVVAEAVG